MRKYGVDIITFAVTLSRALDCLLNKTWEIPVTVVEEFTVAIVRKNFQS